MFLKLTKSGYIFITKRLRLDSGQLVVRDQPVFTFTNLIPSLRTRYFNGFGFILFCFKLVTEVSP